MKYIFSILFFLFIVSAFSQGETEAKRNFNVLKNILSNENDYNKILEKLDSVKLTFKDQRNNYVKKHLNRDIDFGFKHKRLIIFFDLFEHQVDLIIKNDSVYLKSLKTEYFKKLSYQSLNEKQLLPYLEKRNAYYKSKKNLKDLLNEISSNETYARFCGEANSFTDEAAKMEEMANQKDIVGLRKLLSNFSCEKQAFAILGFTFLAEKGIAIPEESKILIEFIKNRNSELQICRGCIIGIVEKIY